MKNLPALILAALRRSRIYAVTILITYVIACVAGILMATYGNEFALRQRATIVGDAVQHSEASINYQAGNKFTAALHDCAGNILYAAVPQTLLGLGIVPPYFTVVYQGWVGGIVSVDGEGRSRFQKSASAAYYMIVMLLQLIPFSLSIGAGILCGVDLYRHNIAVGWKVWRYRIPLGSLRDLGCVYLVTVPLFFAASCFEFLSAWNI